MLKNLNGMTFRYLKKNSKRTIFTLIGIILSMTLVTVGCILLPTAKKIILDQARAYQGDWHLKYEDVTSGFINKIKGNPKVDEILIIKNLDSKKIKNATLNLIGYDGELERTLTKKLKEGRLPQNNNEIVVDDWTLGRLEGEIKLQDNIEFGEKTFKIVGLFYGDPSEDTTSAYVKESVSEDSTAFIKLKEDRNFKENIKDFQEKNKEVIVNTAITDILTGNEESKYYNYIRVSVVILSIITITSTIAIIYNSFNISIMQRTKELGMLRTIGATPKQIKSLVRREALFFSIIGIPLGLISGIGLFQIMLIVFNRVSNSLRSLIGSESLKMIVDFRYILISMIVGFITIYISSLIPTIKASKISPLNCINSSKFIKRDNISKKRGRLLIKFFKIDKVMAYRNLKRNKGRYRITVFSMTLSVIIFFAVFTVSIGSRSIINIEDNESRNIHVISYLNADNDEEFEKVQRIINNMDEIENIYVGYDPINYYLLIPYNKVNKNVIEELHQFSAGQEVEYDGNKYIEIISSIQIYDTSRVGLLNKYLSSGKVDIERFNNGEVLVINNGVISSNGRETNSEIMKLKEGDNFYINFNKGLLKSEFRITEDGYSGTVRGSGSSGTDKNDVNNTLEVKVSGALNTPPFDQRIFSSAGIIMAPETAKNWLNTFDDNNEDSSINIKEKAELLSKSYLEIELKDSKDVNEVVSKIDNILLQQGVQGKVVNIVNKNAKAKGNLLLIDVIGIGFALIVALIGAINIFNTVNTNITLRKREFISLISIGMPMRKIYNMVLTEGVLYGLTSVIFGSIIGTTLCYRLIRIVGHYSSAIQPIVKIISISLIFTVGLGILSTLPGIRRLKRINVIEELKQEN